MNASNLVLRAEHRTSVPRRIAIHLRRHVTDYVALAIMLPLLALWIMPLILMVSTSLKGQAQLRNPGQLIPNPVLWSNYPKAIFDFLPFVTFFKNSFIVSLTTVVGDVISSSFIAYGFARLRFPGRNALFMLLLSTMMIPFIVRMIPLFMVFKQLDWINTFLPLIVPSFFGTPLFVFLMRQFYLGIPQELSDAARIDGASELRIWWNILLPLSKPAMAVVAIMAFQASWNEFLQPLIFLNKPTMFTTTLGLYTLIGGLDSLQPWQYLMAASLVTITPVLILFFAAQRYFMQGVTVSGMKG